MIAAAACAVLALLVCAPPQQRGIELSRAGDARAALAAAEAEPDDLARAQGRVWVHFQAGNLEQALKEARAASDAHPSDLWLAERWTDIALTLRRAGSARQAAERLERLAGSAAAADRARALEQARSAREQADELLRARARRDTAEHTARIVAFGAAGVSLLALVALAAWPLRQRMSRMPADVTGSNRVDGGSQ